MAKKDKANFGTTAAAVEPSPPDYEDADCWYACFAVDGGRNVAAWTPKVSNLHSCQETAACDAFYVHPTTALRGLGNAEVAEDGTFPSFLASTCVKEHASCFNGSCRIFAPKYRQARVSNFHMFEGEADPTGGRLPNYHAIKVGNAAFDVAFQDIERAFNIYLTHWNAGRPFFLVGHSQGSLHLARLLRKLADQPDVFGRLVAAYLPGCQMGADTFGPTLPLGASATQCGCYMTWCTTGPDITSTFATGRRRHGYVERSVMTEGPAWSVNPISWSAAVGVESELDKHRGCTTRESVHPQAIRACCTPEGLLCVRAAESRTFSLRGFANKQGDFHVSDFALFWMDIRENVKLRAASYLARAAQQSDGGAGAGVRSRL